ncbi:hypothetical protein TEGL_22790 [Terrisporobacter glycolicus ATCC 14880 = DSM 1288]|uniref:Metal-binding protein n=1 Tax=Terrisporobacter glycolicus ATCC 14880 = DSM 1288 TaxID=1121315 RepID=A0ABZ2EWG6_9FIRM
MEGIILNELSYLNNSFTTEVFYKKIKVEDILNDYIDVDTFLECCKQCPNYDTRWSCPPYDFDVIDYWKNYKYLHVLGYKITFDEDVVLKTYGEEELNLFIKELFRKQMEFFYEKSKYLEEKYEDSVSLAWGKCYKCDECTRKQSKKCRYENDMRYSIESLGGNVDKLSKDLFNIELKWAQRGKLPQYFFNSIGLLTKENETLTEDEF